VSTTHTSPEGIGSSIACTAAELPTLDLDVLAVPWFEGDDPCSAGPLDQASGGALGRALTSREFSARPYELFVASVADASWHIRRLLFVGAGKREAGGTDVLRRVATAAALWTKQRHVAAAGFAVPAGGDDGEEIVQAVAEGLTLAAFNIGVYKTGGEEPPVPSSWTIVVPGPASLDPRLQARAARGHLLGAYSNRARELANEPANSLTPHEFAQRASRLAKEAGLAVDVLDREQIAQLGMGLLLGVARGSIEPPHLVVLRHDPPGAPAGPVLGLVGKGITFDTGGISIKPADGMDRMKTDMTGGAAVICAMCAISILNAPIRVIGVVPTTENMPGGRAVKPGDVLKGASGKTVEVLNTDAEGRLILGDGLWYARQLGATHLVDVATLTGAIVVALGKGTTGLFGTPASWVEQVRTVANQAGDRMWPMPLVEDYREQLKSEIADLANVGGRPAGSITAALFLEAFTGGLPWVHLDIAGTAWAEEAKPYLPKGPSGVAVRTLAELAFSFGT
jgi:leucyl aminopeptidase